MILTQTYKKTLFFVFFLLVIVLATDSFALSNSTFGNLIANGYARINGTLSAGSIHCSNLTGGQGNFCTINDTINYMLNASNTSLIIIIDLKLNSSDQRYNDTVAINLKLNSSDQRYNDTAAINLKVSKTGDNMTGNLNVLSNITALGISANIDASNLTSGTLALARLPSLNSQHTHAAPNVSGGTFGTGNFGFQNNVTIQGDSLYVGTSAMTVGSATAPLLKLADDDTGIYRPTWNQIGLTTQGNLTITLDINKLMVYVPIQTNSTIIGALDYSNLTGFHVLCPGSGSTQTYRIGDNATISSCVGISSLTTDNIASINASDIIDPWNEANTHLHVISNVTSGESYSNFNFSGRLQFTSSETRLWGQSNKSIVFSESASGGTIDGFSMGLNGVGTGDNNYFEIRGSGGALYPGDPAIPVLFNLTRDNGHLRIKGNVTAPYFLGALIGAGAGITGLDSQHTHAAENVTAGTFSVGNYSFPNTLSSSVLRVGGTGATDVLLISSDAANVYMNASSDSLLISTDGAGSDIALIGNGNYGLYLDATNGYVALGNAVPTQKLHVPGNSNTTGIGYFNSLLADTSIKVGTGAGSSMGNDNLITTGASSAFLNIKAGQGRAKINMGNDILTFVSGNTAGEMIFRTGATNSTQSGTRVMSLNDTHGLVSDFRIETKNLTATQNIDINGDLHLTYANQSSIIYSNAVMDPTMNQYQGYVDDFMYGAAQPPWSGGSIFSGSVSSTDMASTANNVGILLIYTNTSGLGGYYSRTGSAAFLISGGEISQTIFKSRTQGSNMSQIRTGFLDQSSSTSEPVDGVFLRCANRASSTTCNAVARNNDVECNSSKNYNISYNEFYRIKISLPRDLSGADFTLYNNLSVQVWNFTLNSSCLPTAVGRETGHGMQAYAYNTTYTAATTVAAYDYMSVWINRTLVR